MQDNYVTPAQASVGQVNAVTNNAIVAAEVAKVQAQCVLAYQNPRNVLNVENKINAMCESLYLAKEAEYEYTRGGQRITGPTVKLMSTLAQCYGNVTSGWQEIARTKEKSKVIAWAWDIENNYKYDLQFEVPLYRETKTGRNILTSDRDIYEHVANFAARRVRKCIESVIPRYLVDMALEKCHTTLESKVDIKAELKKAVNWLKTYYNVELTQLEEKLGMKYDAFGRVQYASIQKWCNALRDGTAKKEDLFPSKETKNVTPGEVKEKQKQENASIKPEITPTTTEEPQAQPQSQPQDDDWLNKYLDN